MNAAFNNLKTVTETLLSPVMDYNSIRNAAISLNKLFSEVVAFDEMEPANQANIPTRSGTAIAPRWAASCLNDMMRTRKFLLGISDAIKERLKTNPGRPVTVLYAGTGPFASLLTPLITMYSPAQLQMILIEINPVSFQYLQKIIQQFGMEDYLNELVEADAVTYILSGKHQPDIIVSETMNNALQKEPQVSITANLLSQCIRDTVLIPEMIKVDVCLMGDMIKNPNALVTLKTLIELDAATAICIKNNPGEVLALSTGISVTIPSIPEQQYTQLVLCTYIHVFGKYSLGFNESGLTIPHILRITDSFKKYPVRLLFQYQIDNNPGFRVSEI